MNYGEKVLFDINEEIVSNDLFDTKKLILYGLSENTKKILVILAQENIYVSGFLLEDSQSDLLGANYLKKPLYDMESIIEMENEIILLDVFGDNISFLREHLICPVYAVFNLKMAARKVILYGAGIVGKQSLSFLQSRGFEVIYFCDRDSGKRTVSGERGGGVKVILPTEYKEKYLDIPIIVTVRKQNLPSVIHDIEADIKPQEYRILDPSISYMCEDIIYYMNDNGENVIVANSSTMQYFIAKIEKEKKVLVLIGNHEKELKSAISIFNLLDIEIPYAVSIDGFQGKIGKTEVIHFYRLAYIEKNSLIYSLRGTEDTVRKLIVRCGFSGRNFVYNAGGHNSFMEHITLDPSFGYHAKSGNIVLHSKGRKKGKRIAVLGGSTSALYLYPEISWPEYFIQYCEEKGIAVDCICGGVCGYKASNELVKLLRDVLPQRPDIVISYSGVNELWDKESYFLNEYQQKIYHVMAGSLNEKMDGMLMDKNIMNCGEAYESIGEHWLSTEKAMHGICSEFGIDFFGILQPDLFEKTPFNCLDKTVKETLYYKGTPKERHEKLVEIRQYIKQYSFPWLIDFSEVFNDYNKELFFDQWHIYSAGNQFLAQRIFELIEGKLV